MHWLQSEGRRGPEAEAVHGPGGDPRPLPAGARAPAGDLH